MAYVLFVPRSANGNAKEIRVDDFAEASRLYAAIRDARGEGASTFRQGIIRQDGRRIGHVSYNGRVWIGTTWRVGDKPAYDPFT